MNLALTAFCIAAPVETAIIAVYRFADLTDGLKVMLAVVFVLVACWGLYGGAGGFMAKGEPG